MVKEKLQSHLESLQRKHNELDQIIQDEYARYKDDTQVQALKVEKLAIRDEIEKVKNELGTTV